MTLYKAYLDEIAEREKIGLSPKPIDSGELLDEIITDIIDNKSEHRSKSIDFLIYNTLPGTTKAAHSKSRFLKDFPFFHKLTIWALKCLVGAFCSPTQTFLRPPEIIGTKYFVFLKIRRFGLFTFFIDVTFDLKIEELRLTVFYGHFSDTELKLNKETK